MIENVAFIQLTLSVVLTPSKSRQNKKKCDCKFIFITVNFEKIQHSIYLIHISLLINLQTNLDNLKCDNEINQVFFIFNTRELFSEKKRLTSLNPSKT